MGIKGSATCTLTFGDNDKCVGYLLGKEREGMKIMFQMMNEARLDTAMQAHGISSAAYMHSVTYAKNRVQGSSVTKGKTPDAGSVTIVKHPDVRRMLLWMKAYVEGDRMLMLFTAKNLDLSHAATGDEAKEANGLVELLIPISKAGITDTAVLVASEAMQTFGGYGYCSEYPVEQYLRDAKITAIYEGTNGIQSMDLTFRKLLMNPGQYNYNVLKKRISAVINGAKGVVDNKYIDLVAKGVAKVDEALVAMGKELAAGNVESVYAKATPLCRAMYLLTLAYLHLWSLTLTTPKMKALIGNAKGAELEAKLKNDKEAAFYYGKALASQFFIGAEFHHFFGIIDYLLSGDTSVVETSDDIFTGALEA